MHYTEPHYSELSVTYINDIKFGIVKLFIHKLCQNIIRSKMLPEALGPNHWKCQSSIQFSENQDCHN